MNKLVFSETWLVGHKQIDDEHKELFAQINQMIDDLESRNLSGLKSALSIFCRNVISHCDHETQIMRDLGYSEEMHMEGHESIISDLESISATIAEHNMEQKLTDIVSIFIRKILMGDIYFGDYLTNLKAGE